MYKHLENGEGLPMDGFKFYWNPETGTSSNQWQSLAYTSTPFVKTGRYDVLYSGNRDFQTSQPGKFIVKMAPNPPIITESNAGEITITPGAVRQIPIKGSGYYAQSNADKIVINRNGRKLTTFIKNQDGRWELLTGEPDIRGISAKDDGSAILINRTAISEGDTIQAIATEGSGR